MDFISIVKIPAADLPKWGKLIRGIDRRARAILGGVISSTSSSLNRQRRGRRSNGAFAFGFGHPLRLSHRQVIRSKQHVPVPIPSPPRMPEFESPPPLPVGKDRRGCYSPSRLPTKKRLKLFKNFQGCNSVFTL